MAALDQRHRFLIAKVPGGRWSVGLGARGRQAGRAGRAGSLTALSCAGPSTPPSSSLPPTAQNDAQIAGGFGLEEAIVEKKIL